MLSSLSVENTRAFSKKRFEFQPKTLVVGANGTGKSTIIELIRLLSVGKSFRTSRLDEVIQFDAPYFRATALIKSSPEGKKTSKENKIEFFYGAPFGDGAKERQLSVNSTITSLLEHVGYLPSVLFVPGDIEIILGSPSLRRKYLDSILWQVDPAFRQDYLDFTRVLRERAAVLFLLKIRRAGVDELQPWDELLERLTLSIQQKRQQYVTYLQEELKTHPIGALEFTVSYQPNQIDLAASRTQEIQSSQNLFGAHRDELEILLNGRSARRYASRGQARSGVIVLKTIEGQFLAAKTDVEPIILLDDIFSELDETNGRALLEGLGDKHQLIVTAAGSHPLLADWPRVEL